MSTVRQLLNIKGSEVCTVNPSTKLGDVLELMAEKKIGAVLVMDGDHLAGIFSERDFSREVAKSRQLSLDSPIEKYMTKMVFYVSPDVTIEEVMALMTEKRVRHLPVVEKSQVKGIVSIGDVVKEFISQKEITIRSLENYIMGTEYNR